MKFIVEIPDDDVSWANAEAVNRQMIGKFMREELHTVGNRYGGIPQLGEVGPGISHEWRAWIFSNARVRVLKRKETLEIGGIDAATYGR